MFRHPLQELSVASRLRYIFALAATLGACSDGTGPGGDVASVAITQSEPVLAPLEIAIFSAQARDASGLVLNQVPVT
jgi:hypothetical protein